ncbi:uncharacterized protein RHO25_012383 [Cercospora beticola]|uniref:Uncharacterized protein n=1 Tax=Cercospora beticola TaxID=122368 RepID=A0ABZ0P7G0_CERBT|nr:hypothetical protein RHO25_012383 [Cercospora beticola]
MEDMKEGAVNNGVVEDVAISDLEKKGIDTTRYWSVDGARICVAMNNSRIFDRSRQVASIVTCSNKFENSLTTVVAQPPYNTGYMLDALLLSVKALLYGSVLAYPISVAGLCKYGIIQQGVHRNEQCIKVYGDGNGYITGGALDECLEWEREDAGDEDIGEDVRKRRIRAGWLVGRCSPLPTMEQEDMKETLETRRLHDSISATSTLACVQHRLTDDDLWQTARSCRLHRARAETPSSLCMPEAVDTGMMQRTPRSEAALITMERRNVSALPWGKASSLDVHTER